MPDPAAATVPAADANGAASAARSPNAAHTPETAPLGAPVPAPRHVAIVCDGSARWAERNALSVADGHEAAADTVLARVDDAVALGIEQLTLYAFSTENWARPVREVQALLGMLARRIEQDTAGLHAKAVQVRFLGRRDRAGERLLEQIEIAERATDANAGLRLRVALDYGGRSEILSAAERYSGGGEEAFAKLLYDAEMSDPDLVIRTSGEQRLSNFLLWQAAYAELVFRQELWPDFSRAALLASLAEYATRRRRFGAREAMAGSTAV